MSIINIRRDVSSHCESRAQRCHAIPCHPMPYHTVYCDSSARWFVYLFLSRWINIFIVVIGQTYNYFYQMLFTFPFDFHEIVAVIAGTTVVVGSILLCVDLITMNVVQQSVAEQLFSFPQHRFDMSRKQCKIIIEWKICQSADSFVYLVS